MDQLGSVDVRLTFIRWDERSVLQRNPNKVGPIVLHPIQVNSLRSNFASGTPKLNQLVPRAQRLEERSFVFGFWCIEKTNQFFVHLALDRKPTSQRDPDNLGVRVGEVLKRVKVVLKMEMVGL